MAANNFNINQIAPLVSEQFPSFYQTDGPQFIAFMEAYYEWLELTNNPLWYMRNLPELRDIDTTVDDFIVHFQKKYLDQIQFVTASNKRLLVKNSLPFWRSKGTPRAINLLFQLVYGVSADVYYPKTDILKVSDGKWIIPIYLEVSEASENFDYVGRQITGLNSGATAFVERYVRKKLGSKQINIFYVSDLIGNFDTGELLNLDNGAPIADSPSNNVIPIMVGSMTDLLITAGGQNFAVGDIVTIINSDGLVDGLARVAAIDNITGSVTLTLLDGGFGYFANTPIVFSNNVLFVSNVNVSTPNLQGSFSIFEQFVQPLANIVYTGLSGGSFSVNDNIFAYYANTSLAGEGKILAISGNSLFTAVTSGNLDIGTNAIYSTGNVGATANIFSYTDLTAHANVMGLSSNATLHVSNSLFAWTRGMQAYQSYANGSDSANGIVFEVLNTAGANVDLVLNNVKGSFTNNSNIQSRYANGSVALNNAHIYNIDTTIGVIQEANSFTFLPGNFVFGNTSGTTGTLTGESTGSGLNYKIAYLTNQEADTIFTDFLHDSNIANVPYMVIQLNGSNSNVAANGYGFPKFPPGNVNTIMIKCLGTATVNIGTIGALQLVNPGINYDVLPFVLIYNPVIAGAGLRDYAIEINPATSFQIGSIVTETTVVPNSVVLTLGSINAPLDSIFPANGGTAYTNGDIVTVNAPGGGTNANASITTFANGTIYTLTVIGYGKGFVPNSTPTIAITNSTGGTTTGSGATITVDIPTFTLTEPVFEANSTANIATGTVTSFSLSGNSGIVNIIGVSGTFTTANQLSGVASGANAVILNVGSQYQMVAKGLIKPVFANGAPTTNTVLAVRRLSYATSFSVGGTLESQISTANAAIIGVSPDPQSNVIGWDAGVNTQFVAANGVVGDLQVLDSGFGYSNGDAVTFVSSDGTRIGSALALVQHQGIAEGFYKSRDGFLSDNKFIQDGEYYQEFSYEVRTQVPLSLYGNMFKKVMHVSGTKLFAGVYLTSNNNVAITANGSVSLT